MTADVDPGQLRVGQGIDVHAFASDERPLILGGVRLPVGPGLEGHSDADVLTHAVVDALLGAAGLGDLGSRFGSVDPELADASSVGLLEQVLTDLGAAALAVVNVDTTLVAQRPRLAEYRPQLREGLAAALGGLPTDRVSVKITSTDGLGAIGAGEGIAALATCLLRPVGRSGDDVARDALGDLTSPRRLADR